MIKKIFIFLAFLCTFSIICSDKACAQWMDRVSTIPKHRAKNVPLDQVIVLKFRHRLKANIDGNNLLVELQTKTPVKAKIGFSDDFKTITISPNEPLKRNTFYMVAFKDLISNEMELKNIYDCDLQFTTIGGNFRCVAYSLPSEATLPPGGFMDVVYNFKETGGGLGEIKRCTLVYETENGQEISRSSDDMKLILKDNENIKFPSTISVPRNIGEQVKGSKIYIRRLFEGVDSEGNFFTIRTGIKTLVADSTPSTVVSNDEYRATVVSPDIGSVIPKGSLIPAQCSITGIAGQQVHGCWVINGVPSGFFSEVIPQSGKLKNTFSDRSMATKDGINSIAVQIISPEKYLSEACEYIVSSSPIEAPITLAPKKSQIFKKSISQAPTFVWANVNGALSYKISISKDKKPDSSSKWIPVEINRYTPNWVNWGNLGSGVFYWSVVAIFPGGKESNPETSTFMISDGNN